MTLECLWNQFADFSVDPTGFDPGVRSPPHARHRGHSAGRSWGAAFKPDRLPLALGAEPSARAATTLAAAARGVPGPRSAVALSSYLRQLSP